MQIQIKHLSETEIQEKRIKSWPIWTCGISEFDWEYSEQESCLFLEGQVEVTTASETVRFSTGDFVVFPKGLQCKWNVIQAVTKHYKFG